MSKQYPSNYFLDLLTKPEALREILDSQDLWVALVNEEPGNSTKELHLLLPKRLDYDITWVKTKLDVYINPVRWRAKGTTGPFNYTVIYHKASEQVLVWYKTQYPITLLKPPGTSGETFTLDPTDENGVPVPIISFQF
jgi:hypothetical protein